jgi:hypothetical protein
VLASEVAQSLVRSTTVSTEEPIDHAARIFRGLERMKILPLVSAAFEDQKELAPILISELTSLFESRNSKWFFDIRPKGDESFALKADSGRLTSLNSAEDFVGCMLVVPLQTDLPVAQSFVEEFFELVYRRPGSDDTTLKSASDFPFDDLRLYGHLRPRADLPPRPIDLVLFEVQIKTYLQHAWSIATHDLVYKYERVSWARNRIAYQIKALLEHAELAVSSIAELEGAGNLPAHGSPEDAQQKILEKINSEWPIEDLPTDRRRLATNVWTFLIACQIDLSQFDDLLERGRTISRGEHPRTLSPFQCVVEYASVFYEANVRDMLSGAFEISGQYRIPVTQDVLERVGLDRQSAVRAFV